MLVKGGDELPRNPLQLDIQVLIRNVHTASYGLAYYNLISYGEVLYEDYNM